MLAGALFLFAGAMQAQELDVPQSACRGQEAEIAFEETGTGSSFFGFAVRQSGGTAWEDIEFEIKHSSAFEPHRVIWNVSAAQPIGGYRLTAKVGASSSSAEWTHEYSIDVKNCSNGPNPGDVLAQALYEFERQLWEEHVMSSTWPPEPGCHACSSYEVDVAEMLSIFESSGLDQTLAVRVLDGRGRPFAEIGNFARVRGRYTNNPRSVTVETSPALAARRHCGMQIEVTDVSGNLFGTAPICLDVVGRR